MLKKNLLKKTSWITMTRPNVTEVSIAAHRDDDLSYNPKSENIDKVELELPFQL